MTRWIKPLFWICLLLAMANYAVMVLWSLPRVQAAAGGATPFDMRPTGYDTEDALAFLGQITPEGRSFYLDVQQWLDTSYPPLLALTLATAVLWLAPRVWGHWRFALAALALPVAVFDWLENARIARLLQASDVNPAMIAAASQATVLKATLSTIMILVVMALAVWAVWQHMSRAR